RVSRHHCTFFEQDGQVWVQDLMSRNGTWLNGEPLKYARPVRDGDWLELAHVPFLIRLHHLERGRRLARSCASLLPVARGPAGWQPPMSAKAEDQGGWQGHPDRAPRAGVSSTEEKTVPQA